MHGGGIKRIAAVCFRQVIEVDDIKLGFNRVLCLVFLEGVICKFGLVVKLEIEQQATKFLLDQLKDGRTKKISCLARSGKAQTERPPKDVGVIYPHFPGSIPQSVFAGQIDTVRYLDQFFLLWYTF